MQNFDLSAPRRDAPGRAATRAQSIATRDAPTWWGPRLPGENGAQARAASAAPANARAEIEPAPAAGAKARAVAATRSARARQGAPRGQGRTRGNKTPRSTARSHRPSAGHPASTLRHGLIRPRVEASVSPSIP